MRGPKGTDDGLYLVEKLSDELVMLSDFLDHAVRDSRAAGVSWRRIGEATGYSEMGARRRWRVEVG